MEANAERLRLRDGGDELLHVSSSDNTWRQIAPTAPWLHSPRIIGSNRPETFVLVNHVLSEDHIQAVVYSPRDDDYYKLDPLPDLDGEVQRSSHYVPLEGKVYALGVHVIDRGFKLGSSDVYVWDPDCPSKWEKCASLQTPRLRFTCGLAGGKLYVCGGNFFPYKPVDEPVCEPEVDAGVDGRYRFLRQAEVYDPTENTWSPIDPMVSLRVDHHIATLGDEICVLGGSEIVCDPEFDEIGDSRATRRRGERRGAAGMDIYHPVDNWRVVEAFGRSGGNGHQIIFVADGKFYSMDQEALRVRDDKNDTWTLQYSVSFPELEIDSLDDVYPVAIVALEDELIARVMWFDSSSERTERSCLFRSRGFGGVERKIEWRKANFPISYAKDLLLGEAHAIYPIQIQTGR